MSERISRVEVFHANVPFRHDFTLGSGTVGSGSEPGDVVFVRIETNSGAVGWGEQRALPIWSYETAETIVSVIENNLAPLVIGTDPFDVERFHAAADRVLKPSVSNGFPFARAAVDIALHDLAGIIAGVPVHRLLGGAIVERLPLCSAIGAASPDHMAARATESGAYPAYKLKITGDPGLDAQRIRRVVEVTGDKPIWLDANQAYRPMAYRRLVSALADLPTIVVAEQPVPSPDWFGLRAARESTALPLAVDEGCFTATDLAKLGALARPDAVVLKVCKSGGLRRLLSTASVAKANGIELLGSGLTDCGIAFAAGVHVLSTLELSLPAELNGPELLDELFVDGLDLRDGSVAVPSAPGLGVTVDEDAIREASRAR
ncbi:mandelate racemase/muconate lactonizing enzyme family protein [Rathayibacter sp. CAU 1779]